MGDTYREILIKKEKSPAAGLLRGALIVVNALVFAAGILLHPLFLLVGVVLAAVLVLLVFPRFDVEYEYLYVNGSFDIDVIYARQKRKKAASYDLNDMEFLAPAQSHALDSYKNGGDIKLRDFTSGNPEVKSYILVFNREKQRELVKMELDDEVIRDIRRLAPRKVDLPDRVSG